MIRFDTSALCTLILDKYGEYRSFAAALGVKFPTMAAWILEGRIPHRHIVQMVEILGIPDADVQRVFFTRI